MPLIQLDFENKLNTSVQTGDVAYFSNPIDYGTAGNSLNNGDQWSSTTTPHLTSNQSDIIKIGVIETIIPWDGEVNSIICDMPQNLFNQYFSQIQAPVCTTTPPTTIITPGTGSGDCANYAPILDADPVIASTIPGTTPSGLSNYAALGGFQSNNNHFKWFFDNPTVNFSDRSFHVVGDGPGGCPVDPSKQGFISGFDNNSFIRKIILSLSDGSTRNPVSESLIISGIPPTFVAIIGFFINIASIIVCPKPSNPDNSKKISMDENISLIFFGYSKFPNQIKF